MLDSRCVSVDDDNSHEERVSILVSAFLDFCPPKRLPVQANEESTKSYISKHALIDNYLGRQDLVAENDPDNRELSHFSM